MQNDSEGRGLPPLRSILVLYPPPLTLRDPLERGKNPHKHKRPHKGMGKGKEKANGSDNNLNLAPAGKAVNRTANWNN